VVPLPHKTAGHHCKPGGSAAPWHVQWGVRGGSTAPHSTAAWEGQGRASEGHSLIAHLSQRLLIVVCHIDVVQGVEQRAAHQELHGQVVHALGVLVPAHNRTAGGHRALCLLSPNAACPPQQQVYLSQQAPSDCQARLAREGSMPNHPQPVRVLRLHACACACMWCL